MFSGQEFMISMGAADFLNFTVAGSEPIINVDGAIGVDGLGLTIVFAACDYVQQFFPDMTCNNS
jgi:hypothetical protein